MDESAELSKSADAPLPDPAGDSEGAPLPAGRNEPDATAEPAREHEPDFGTVGATEPAVHATGGVAGSGAIRVGPAAGEGAGGGKPARPPIRPVGYRPAGKAAWLLVAATLVQMGWLGYVAYYFYDLQRYDWVAYVDVTVDALQGLPDWDSPGGFVASLPAAEEVVMRRRRYEQFERDLKFLVPVHLGLYWLELGALMYWQYRTHRNLEALGTAEQRHEPATSTVWWVVPLVNWWLPVVVMQEIWRGSDPNVPSGDGRAWRVKRGSAMIGLWRVIDLLAKVLFWFCLLMFVFRMHSTVNPPMLALVGAGTAIVACLLQLLLVRTLGARQEALYRKRMRAAEKAAAAGEPVVEAQVPEEEER